MEGTPTTQGNAGECILPASASKGCWSFHFAGNSEADPAPEWQTILASGEDIYHFFFPLVLFDCGFLKCMRYFKHYIEYFLKNNSLSTVYAWVVHRRDLLFEISFFNSSDWAYSFLGIFLCPDYILEPLD